jgi:hypothetical protein
MNDRSDNDIRERLLRLEARNEILDVLHRYCRAVDRTDKELLLELYHPDAIDDHGFFRGDPDEYAAWVIPMLKGYSKHHTHTLSNTLIEFGPGPDEAKVESHIWACHVPFEPADGEDVVEILVGRFLDRFERRDGKWLIAHRLLVVDWDTTIPLSSAFGDPSAWPGGLPPRGGRRGEDPLDTHLLA